jgi:predicted nucleic acid-binding protein
MATAYIETTIPSYYVARPSNSLLQAARQANTRTWWDSGCSGFELFTSQETLDETGRGEPAMAEDRLALIRDLPILEVSESTARLTRTLLSKGLIPTKAASDAIHIAVASAHGMDYLVTWNFKHIANPYIRERLRQMVLACGLMLPVICTPEELLNDETD